MKTTLTVNKIENLKKFGERIGVKVTSEYVRTSREDSTMKTVIHIRDEEFDNFNSAALRLIEIENDELHNPHLIG